MCFAVSAEDSASNSGSSDKAQIQQNKIKLPKQAVFLFLLVTTAEKLRQNGRNPLIKNDMHDLDSVLITGMVFGTIYGIFYLFIRRRERLTMMEKGVDASMFVSDTKSFNKSTLKFGMLFIGIGVGVLFGNILAVNSALHEEVAYFSMIFLFGGFALVANYLIEKSESKK